MQIQIYRPKEAGRFPAIIFYSEIFQITAHNAQYGNYLKSYSKILGYNILFRTLS